jgi:hypothetical protein
MNIHALSVIQTPDSRNQPAVDLCRRQHSHRDRLSTRVRGWNSHIFMTRSIITQDSHILVTLAIFCLLWVMVCNIADHSFATDLSQRMVCHELDSCFPKRMVCCIWLSYWYFTNIWMLSWKGCGKQQLWGDCYFKFCLKTSRKTLRKTTQSPGQHLCPTELKAKVLIHILVRPSLSIFLSNL